MFTNIYQKIFAIKKYWSTISYFDSFERYHVIFERKSFLDCKIRLCKHEEYVKYVMSTIGEHTDPRLLIRDVLTKSKGCVFIVFEAPEGYVQFWIAQGRLQVCWFLDIYDKDEWKKDKKIIISILRKLKVPRCMNARNTNSFETYYAFFKLDKDSVSNEDGLNATADVPIFRADFNNDNELASHFVIQVLEQVYNLKTIEDLSVDLN
ncbi:hypothetical protein KA111_00545 [Candidatus Woesebacteria bacterium]|nr:hypothetical protein [Candidatus Woesebacteria bacterium]